MEPYKTVKIDSPYYQDYNKLAYKQVQANKQFVPNCERFAFVTAEGSTAVLSMVVGTELIPVHTCSADEGRIHSVQNMPAYATYVCSEDITIIGE